MTKHTIYALSLFSLLIVWQLYAFYVGNAILFPGPLKVGKTVFDLLSQLSTYKVIGFSILRLLISISIALISGISLGFLGGLSEKIHLFLTPFVSGLRSLPVASLIAVILVLYANEVAIFVIGFLVLFPIIYEATKEGVKNIDPQLKAALKLEPNSIILTFFAFHFPLAFPYIKTGLLQSIGLGFKVLVMAEFIAQTQNSIGRSLNIGRINFQYDVVFAWTIIIIIIVYVFELAVSKLQSL